MFFLPVSSVRDIDCPRAKILSKRKEIGRTRNMTQKIGEFMFDRSAVVLDTVKIWRIGQQIEQLASDIFDNLPNPGGFTELRDFRTFFRCHRHNFWITQSSLIYLVNFSSREPDMDSHIVKIESKRQGIVKIGRITPKVRECSREPGPIMLDTAEIWRIWR
jgi:hypothetical protein